ncbi:MAG TPA: hypothetical protein VG674_20565 [Amycolatopsis sp.]|nr:hypothetical protein [Amycolatopsis sp.]
MGGAVRAVVVLVATVGGWVALVLPSARFVPGKFPAGLAGPELSVALRVVCAIALAGAFALGWVALTRRRGDVLAFTALPGLIVVGIAAQYLVRSLPRLADRYPAAGITTSFGIWLLLGAGLLVTATGLAAGYVTKNH